MSAAASAAGWIIRPGTDGDWPALARLYVDSVRHLGAACYTPEQIRAWSAFGEATDEFEAWLADADTFVAADRDDVCIGFAGIDATGRIASLYVAPAWMRRGVASGLLKFLLQTAAERGFERVTTEASYFSKPVFVKHGFDVTEDEYVQFDGVEFHRFRMHRALTAQSDHGS